MRRWLVDNGLYVFYVLIALYGVASFSNMSIVIRSISSILFLLFYGVMSSLMYRFHHNKTRLTLQLLVVIGAIILKIITIMIGFNIMINSLSFIFLGLLVWDTFTLEKLYRVVKSR